MLNSGAKFFTMDSDSFQEVILEAAKNKNVFLSAPKS